MTIALSSFILLWGLALGLAVWLMRQQNEFVLYAGRLLTAVAAGTAPHVVLLAYVDYSLQSGLDEQATAERVHWYE